MSYPRYQRYSETQSSYEPDPQPSHQPPRRPRGSFLDSIGLGPVTLALIIVNVVVFALEYLPATEMFMNYQALSIWSLYNGMWWTLLTSMFMHGGIMHILFNMVSLFYFGPIIERAFGPVKFLILYIVSGIVGGLAFVGVSYMTMTISAVVGASGAIFGLFGAYGVLLLKERKHPVILLAPPSSQALISYFSLIVINILVSLTPGIAMESHIGGFVAGILLGLVFYGAEVKRLRA